MGKYTSTNWRYAEGSDEDANQSSKTPKGGARPSREERDAARRRRAGEAPAEPAESEPEPDTDDDEDEDEIILAVPNSRLLPQERRRPAPQATRAPSSSTRRVHPDDRKKRALSPTRSERIATMAEAATANDRAPARRANYVNPRQILGDLVNGPAVQRLLNTQELWRDIDLNRILPVIRSNFTFFDDYEALKLALVEAGLNVVDRDEDEESEAEQPRKRRKAGEEEDQMNEQPDQEPGAQIDPNGPGMLAGMRLTDIQWRQEDQGSTNSAPASTDGFDPEEANTELAQQVLGPFFNRPSIQEVLWRNPNVLQSKEALQALKRALQPSLSNNYPRLLTRFQQTIAERGLTVDNGLNNDINDDLDNDLEDDLEYDLENNLDDGSEPQAGPNTYGAAPQAFGFGPAQPGVQLDEAIVQATRLERFCQRRAAEFEQLKADTRARLETDRSEIERLELQQTALRTENTMLENQNRRLLARQIALGLAPRSQDRSMGPPPPPADPYLPRLQNETMRPPPSPPTNQYRPQYPQNSQPSFGTGRNGGFGTAKAPAPAPSSGRGQFAAPDLHISEFGHATVQYGRGFDAATTPLAAQPSEQALYTAPFHGDSDYGQPAGGYRIRVLPGQLTESSFASPLNQPVQRQAAPRPSAFNPSPANGFLPPTNSPIQRQAPPTPSGSNSDPANILMPQPTPPVQLQPASSPSADVIGTQVERDQYNRELGGNEFDIMDMEWNGQQQPQPSFDDMIWPDDDPGRGEEQEEDQRMSD